MRGLETKKRMICDSNVICDFVWYRLVLSNRKPQKNIDIDPKLHARKKNANHKLLFPCYDRPFSHRLSFLRFSSLHPPISVALALEMKKEDAEWKSSL